MSKFLVPPIYNGRGLENQWLNNTVQAHDCICGCNKPFEHLQYLIDQQKCHHSTEDGTFIKETTGTTHTNEDILDDVDLEKLFEQETDENAG